MSELDGDLHLLETFGMFGGPTEMLVVADPTMTPPVEPTPGYEVLTSGYARPIGMNSLEMPAFHEIKARGDVTAVKLGAFFPANAPTPIAAGHSLHMAIEFWNLAHVALSSDETFG